MRLTEKRKELFLAELARHGVVARAARAASPQSDDPIRGALQTFRDARVREPEFAAAWDAALETARADVEHELFRRAQEGWEEPVFGGRYREVVVGTVRRYSDRLLELRAKALLPEYREHSRLDVTADVTAHRGDLAEQVQWLSDDELTEFLTLAERCVQLEQAARERRERAATLPPSGSLAVRAEQCSGAP